MKDFLLNNWQYITPLLTLIVGWLVPNDLLYSLGAKVRTKLPRDISKLIASKLDAFEHGLLDSKVEGNRNLIHNNDFKKDSDKLKIDLGLKG